MNYYETYRNWSISYFQIVCGKRIMAVSTRTTIIFEVLIVTVSSKFQVRLHALTIFAGIVELYISDAKCWYVGKKQNVMKERGFVC